ncbi:cysteine hydrolase family protein [Methylobacterium aquaticum]|uniref:cysteine hydrolase family protein n=1 Tax=Methylobacterium aquaticum TaxID=270351 RepID=UPI001931EB50|nr:cysteine hydrolase [Methylobacterium aquaticum]QRE76822.1 cysteine hydrolase [Methylobacterium aquaticum]
MLGLVIIDMQQWMFRKPERLKQVENMLPAINGLASRCARANLPIYDVVTVHQPDKSTWSRLMIKYDYSCLIEGTPDAEPVGGYVAPPSATRIVKTQNSVFLHTNFEATLHAGGVTKLMLAGVFMDGCVGLTAADAAQRQFEVVCVSDAIGHVDAEMRQLMEKWLYDMYEIEQIRAGDVVI